MSFSGLFYTAFLSVSLVFLAQAPEPKEMPDNKGSIEGENVYHNPTLNMTITLPGSWHFFDRTMYLTAEEKQKKKERYEKSLSTCVSGERTTSCVVCASVAMLRHDKA